MGESSASTRREWQAENVGDLAERRNAGQEAARLASAEEIDSAHPDKPFPEGTDVVLSIDVSGAGRNLAGGDAEAPKWLPLTRANPPAAAVSQITARAEGCTTTASFT